MWKSHLPCNIYVSSQLSVLSRQVGDLQADNLKLYEKIRFLQVISIMVKCLILLRQNIASKSNVESCWENSCQACGGGSRRSEVVVPVENRHDIISITKILACNAYCCNLFHLFHILNCLLAQVPGELWAEAGSLLQLQQARAAEEVWPALCIWEGASSFILLLGSSLKKIVIRWSCPLCGLLWATKLPAWLCSSTPFYFMDSSLPSSTNSSWQNHAGE